MTTRLFTLYVFFHTLIAGCGGPRSERGEPQDATDLYTIGLLGRMQRQEVRESSGLALADPSGNSFWTHGDGGAPSALYKVQNTGELLQTLPVPNASNHDWEDLARDPRTGRLYLGDFGNNRNARRDLMIYILDPANPVGVDTIRFSYPDQHQFPPAKKERNFDCEAFYFAHDSLYLFTKNRGKGGLWTKQYRLPARPGTYVATLLDSLELETWVTAADIAPDGRTMALLGYGFVYLFEGEPKQRVFDRRRLRIRLAKSGQAEALTFVNNHNFVFTNESGKLFRAGKSR